MFITILLTAFLALCLLCFQPFSYRMKNLNCYKNLIFFLELLQQAIFECASKPYISML